MPTLADGTVAVIMLNLVQVLLDSSSTIISSLMKLHWPQTQFKHRNTGDVFVFTWVTAVCADVEIYKLRHFFQPLSALVCAAHTFILLLRSYQKSNNEQSKWPIYNTFTLNMYTMTTIPMSGQEKLASSSLRCHNKWNKSSSGDAFKAVRLWGRLLYSFTSNRHRDRIKQIKGHAGELVPGQEVGRCSILQGEAGLMDPSRAERFYLVSWPTTFSRVLFSCLSCSFSSSMSSRSCEKGKTHLDSFFCLRIEVNIICCQVLPSSQAAVIATN